MIAQVVKGSPAMQETPVPFLGREDPLEKGQATRSSVLGLPCGSAGKEPTCNGGGLGSIPGFRRSPGEGKGYTVQNSSLDNSMDCTVHEVAKSWTRLSDFKFTSLHFHFTKAIINRQPMEWEKILANNISEK